MPFYEFQCQACQEVFEVRATIKQREAGLYPECPACHTSRAKPLITASFAVHGSAGGGVSSSAGSTCHGCSGGHCGSCH